MFRPSINIHLPSSTLRAFTAPPLLLQPKLPLSHAADVIFPKVSILLLFEPPGKEEEIVARVDRLLSRPGVVVIICIGGARKSGCEKEGREVMGDGDGNWYGVMIRQALLPPHRHLQPSMLRLTFLLPAFSFSAVLHI